MPENFVFQAGQHVKLFFDDGSFKLYSIAKAPGHNTLEFHIQEPINECMLKEFLLSIHERSYILISESMGKCTSPNSVHNPTLLIAGGCGFAHSLSIIQDISQKESVDYPVHLYWGVDKLSDLYYQEYLTDLQFNTDWFKFEIILGNPINSWKGRVGLVTDYVFKDYQNLQNFCLFASGPTAMIETAYRKAISNKLNPMRFNSDHNISITAHSEAVAN